MFYLKVHLQTLTVLRFTYAKSTGFPTYFLELQRFTFIFKLEAKSTQKSIYIIIIDLLEKALLKRF